MEVDQEGEQGSEMRALIAQVLRHHRHNWMPVNDHKSVCVLRNHVGIRCSATLKIKQPWEV